MKKLTYARSLHDLNLLKNEGMDEVVLEHKDFSRFGKLDDEQFLALAARARELNLKISFEWDVLMTEKVFQRLKEKLPSFLPLVDALRVQDPGALEWSLRNTQLPLQFLAETGNHNIEALKGWVEYCGKRLERVALSIELSRNVIEEYVKALDVPCELLGFGRILLFYSPRSLLSPLTPEKLAVNEELAALGESEESPHKGFPLVENRHGTFMFHIKEFCLLEYAQELEAAGLNVFRLDLRWEGLQWLSNMKGEFATFKAEYPQDLMRGFYLVNKTDVLFPKLKNHRLQKREGDYVGEVLEAEKGSHLAIMVKNPRGLKLNERLKLVHPTGKIFEMEVKWLKDLGLEEVESVPAHKIALVPFVNGVWAKSHAFYLT